MADSADDPGFSFYKPYMRGLIPIDTLHIPKKLLKTLRKNPYTVTVDKAFRSIIDGCAQTSPDSAKRDKTWINKPIRDLFVQLYEEGHAHSVECWTKEGSLAGGLYGLAIGGVFCGESMVSFEKDASKIALVYLCAILKECGFTVLDTQFINPHLLQFGAYEVPQEEYEVTIKEAMKKPVIFVVEDTMELIIQTYLFKCNSTT